MSDMERLAVIIILAVEFVIICAALVIGFCRESKKRRQ